MECREVDYDNLYAASEDGRDGTAEYKEKENLLNNALEHLLARQREQQLARDNSTNPPINDVTIREALTSHGWEEPEDEVG